MRHLTCDWSFMPVRCPPSFCCSYASGSSILEPPKLVFFCSVDMRCFCMASTMRSSKACLDSGSIRLGLCKVLIASIKLKFVLNSGA